MMYFDGTTPYPGLPYQGEAESRPVASPWWRWSGWGAGTRWYLAFAALFLVMCNLTNPPAGYGAPLRNLVTLAFLLLAVVVFARRWRVKLTALPQHLGGFAAFGALIGLRHLLSHGLIYAQMAADFGAYSADASLSRRLAMPGLAHLLGVGPELYVLFWYGVLLAAFCAADGLLIRGGFALWERLSLLSSSIFAFLLVIPGYSEVLVMLGGLFALSHRLSMVEKIILAAVALGSQEVMAVMVMLPVALKSSRRERAEWAGIFALLIAAYGFGYAANWRFDVAHALTLALRPDPRWHHSSLFWLMLQPARGLLAVAVSYKLGWVLVLAALARGTASVRWMALGVLAGLPLILLAADTSRVVQFSSLAFLVLACETLPAWNIAARRWLLAGNLLLPSFYVSTIIPPVWGRGIYGVYLYVSHRLGLDWGAYFFT